MPPFERPRNLLWWTSQETRLASFWSWDSQLSNDAEFSSWGVHHLVIRGFCKDANEQPKTDRNHKVGQPLEILDNLHHFGLQWIHWFLSDFSCHYFESTVSRDGERLKTWFRRRLKAGALSFQTMPPSFLDSFTTTSYEAFQTVTTSQRVRWVENKWDSESPESHLFLNHRYLD